MTDATETEQMPNDAEVLRSLEGKPLSKRLGTYVRLTGPGWMQSALTLGGGSLASSLYLGTLTGFSMLWLQPLAMILGIIMLCAIGYVTLSTGERPYFAVKDHINPVLGWAWALASLIASMVWALPQYTLANGVLQQNLFPTVLGPDSALGAQGSSILVALVILVICTVITWNYGTNSKGVRLYESSLKVVVAIIVLAFIGVVVRLALSPPGLDFAAFWKGLIPNPGLIFRPAAGYEPLLDALPADARAYWSQLIVDKQQQVMAAAFATAVGINMTFLFGYSLLKRRWGREFRGFMKFDLATGMFIPFILAISCVVMASATQFYTVPVPGLVDAGSNPTAAPAPARQVEEYRGMLVNRLAIDGGPDLSQAAPAEVDRLIGQLDPQERTMAAVLVTRDAFDLANSLKPAAGDFFSRIVFGIGVLGMALSTITLMMVISGMVICEMLDRPMTGATYRWGSMLAAVGALGPFFWSKAAFWLAIPTSIIGLVLLPIAYVTFLIMMNRRRLLGADRPVGGRRTAWNILMIFAVTIVALASVYMLWKTTGITGIIALVVFIIAVGIGEVVHPARPRLPDDPERRKAADQYA